MMGLLIDLDYIKVSGAKFGTAYKDVEYATFGETDVYVCDANNNLYYVKGYQTEDGLIYQIEGKTQFNTPVIVGSTYILHSNLKTAMISIEAYTRTDTSITVKVGDEVAGYKEGNRYYIEVNKNGEYEISVFDEYGNTTTSKIKITGISEESEIEENIIGPVITSFVIGEQEQRAIKLHASAIDSKYGITGYAFSYGAGLPSSEWVEITKTESPINVTFDATKTGTYYFWVKNSKNVASSSQINVEIRDIFYDIIYELNGGKWSDGISRNTEKLDDEEIEITNDIPEKAGYKFEGWSSKNNGVVDYNSGSRYSDENELKLYAVWTARTDVPYKVEHYKENANGNYELEETDNFTGTTEQFVNADHKEYEHFYLNTSVIGTIDSGNIIGNGSLVLKLYYSRSSYKVTLTGENGTQIGAGSYKHGTTVNIKNNPARGYGFKEWQVENINDINKSESQTSFIMPTYDVSLKAVNEIITYTISYDLVGGNISSNNPVAYNVKDTITLNNPQKNGYRFKGWTGTDLTSVTSPVTISNKIGDRTYTANYDELFNLSLIDGTPTYGKVQVKVSSIDNVTFEYSINDGNTWTRTGALQNISNSYVTNIDIFKNTTVRVRALKPDNSVENEKEIIVNCILDETEANAPVLGDGMTAVWWDENVEKSASEFSSQVYNYTSELSNNKWANAKTEDGSYWVWIPRFAYKIQYYTNESRTTISETKTGYEKIFIMFLNENSQTECKKKNSSELINLLEGYKVCDAFNYVGTELTGIWVAKYEASSENSNSSLGGGNILTNNAGNIDLMNLVSKPNLKSWRGISYENAIKNSQAMYSKYSSQLISNDEWEAVALLTQSMYGLNTTKLVENAKYITGNGGSSNGNATGIYDLYGGAWEYVRGDKAFIDLSLIKYLDESIKDNDDILDGIGRVFRGSGNKISTNNNLPLNGGTDSRIGYRVVLHIAE